MSQEKNRSDTMDMAGRILSVEQRVKGLQGRIAALETRLSSAGVSPVGNSLPAEDFVPAARHIEAVATARPHLSADETVMANTALQETGTAVRLPARQALDVTGLLAGAILIGAGLLLLTGNLEIIKNPLAAIGCGILLIAGSLKRMLYK